MFGIPPLMRYGAEMRVNDPWSLFPRIPQLEHSICVIWGFEAFENPAILIGTVDQWIADVMYFFMRATGDPAIMHAEVLRPETVVWIRRNVTRITGRVNSVQEGDSPYVRDAYAAVAKRLTEIVADRAAQQAEHSADIVVHQAEHSADIVAQQAERSANIVAQQAEHSAEIVADQA